MIMPILIAAGAYGAWRWHKRIRGYRPAPKGDVLAAVAQRFGVPIEAILAANGPGFARMYAPSGMPVPFKLPSGVKDSGPIEGARGRYIR